MRLGLSSYTLTWSVGVPGYETPGQPLSAYELIELAAAHGLDLVQMADNMPLDSLTAGELAELRQFADRSGVALEVGTRGTSPALLLTYLNIAEALGSPFVRTLITEPDLDRAEAELHEVLPHYAGKGIAIAVENYGLHTTVQLADLFRATDSPFLGCCLDTVNSFGALEAPDVVIDRLLPYTINLHIKDFDIRRVDHQMGFEIIGAPAGAGRLAIGELKEKLHRAGRNATAVLELWTPYAGSVGETIALERSWMEQSLHYLRSIRLMDNDESAS